MLTLVHVAEDMMYDLKISAIFYTRLLKKNFAVEIIPKEEQGWKSIRKRADNWRSVQCTAD